MQSSIPRRLLCICLFLLAGLVAGIAPLAAAPPAQTAPPTERGEVVLDSVNDWEDGTVEDLLVTNNAGGELRLADDTESGEFLSAVYEADFGFNVAGATWRAEIPPGTDLSLELRTSTSRPAAAGSATWGDWQPLVAGDARSQADDGAFAIPATLAFPPDTRYLQLRLTLTTTIARASPVVDRVQVVFLNTTGGPAGLPAGYQREPIRFGREVLTARPTLIPRLTWSGQLEAARPERAQPRGIILHDIPAAPEPAQLLPYLRGLARYQIDVLGWEDMAFHYLIDAEGNLYEGRLGGPASVVGRLSGGDTAIHIGLIGPRDEELSTEAQARLVSLLAWLSQAFEIAPAGEHTVLVGGSRTVRPNVTTYDQIALDPDGNDDTLAALLPQLRERTDESIVRARWYFPEGNVAEYSQRLSFFNPTASDASATVTLLQPETGLPVTEIVTVPAGRRADLVVTEVVTPTSAVPSIVESNAPILVERSLGTQTDIGVGPGINQLARIWYFPEGSTQEDFATYLVLFNPHPMPVQAEISYLRQDVLPITEQITIPPQQRYVVITADRVPDLDFSMRVVASHPIAAERTMRFGEELSGLHTGSGITRLARRWLFAEGTTEPPFEMRLLLLNPNEQIANTRVTFMTPDGTTLVRNYALPAMTRLAVDVNDVVPDLGVATMVSADRPIAAERALYFNDGDAGTVSAGAREPAFSWYFVEGRSADATMYLLLSNPNRTQTVVTVDFVLFDGTLAQQRVVMPANSRYTLAVHEFYPDETSIAMVVRATQPIVAERSLFPGGGTRGGATSLGIPGPVAVQ